MSHRGILSNKLYVDISVEFEKVWDNISTEEQKNVVSENIDLLDDSELISIIEGRGYTVIDQE